MAQIDFTGVETASASPLRSTIRPRVAGISITPRIARVALLPAGSRCARPGGRPRAPRAHAKPAASASSTSAARQTGRRTRPLRRGAHRPASRPMRRTRARIGRAQAERSRGEPLDPRCRPRCSPRAAAARTRPRARARGLLALELGEQLRRPVCCEVTSPSAQANENREEEEVQFRHRAPGSIRSCCGSKGARGALGHPEDGASRPRVSSYLLAPTRAPHDPPA